MSNVILAWAICASAAATSGPKRMLHLDGVFVEGCTCRGTCTFEATGATPTCKAMGGYRVDRGSFGGRDISGCRMAFVVGAEGVLYLYYDSKRPDQAETVRDLSRTLFGAYGKLVSISAARVDVLKGRGKWELTVNVGETLRLTGTPLLGGDGKTPVVLRNVYGEPYDELKQGVTTSASFQHPKDGFRFTRTSFFYVDRLAVRKRV